MILACLNNEVSSQQVNNIQKLLRVVTLHERTKLRYGRNGSFANPCLQGEEEPTTFDLATAVGSILSPEPPPPDPPPPSSPPPEPPPGNRVPGRPPSRKEASPEVQTLRAEVQALATSVRELLARIPPGE